LKPDAAVQFRGKDGPARRTLKGCRDWPRDLKRMLANDGRRAPDHKSNAG
jgi:hypothetical protein